MSCKLSYIIVGLTLSASLLASCRNKKLKDDKTNIYSSGAVTFTSDESFSPVIEEERELSEFTYPEAKLTPIYTNESGTINKLLRGEVFMAITSRGFTKDELESLRTNKQFPRSIKFAYDGLALVQSMNNTNFCISVDNIRKVFNGEVARWSQIYPHSEVGDITVVFDNPNSSAVHYVEDFIPGGKPIANKNIAAIKKTEETIRYVEESGGAIGIIGSSWLDNKHDNANPTFKKEMHPMAVSSILVANVQNGWKPYRYYFYSANYPLVRTLYILLNDTRMGLPTGFSNFIILQDKGQRIILRSRLLPVHGNLTIRNVHTSG